MEPQGVKFSYLGVPVCHTTSPTDRHPDDSAVQESSTQYISATEIRPIEDMRRSSMRTNLFRHEMSGVVVYDSAARICDDRIHRLAKAVKARSPVHRRELEGPNHNGNR